MEKDDGLVAQLEAFGALRIGTQPPAITSIKRHKIGMRRISKPIKSDSRSLIIIFR